VQKTTTTATDSSITTNSAKKTPVRYAFLYCNSPSTQRQYPKRLKLFFDFVGIEGNDLEEQGQNFLDKARQDSEWAQQSLMTYLAYHKQRVLRKEISAGTLKTMWVPIKTFMDAFDDVADIIKWKRVSKSLPHMKTYSNDRVPTIEEVRRLVEYPDRRIKAIVYSMCSSGIRIGAFDFLKWKHVTPITNDKTGELLAAKLLVYAEEPEQYFTFITPEAFNAIKAWMDFRKLYGEQITGESWVIRNNFAVADLKRERTTPAAAASKKHKGGGNNRRTTTLKRLDNKSIGRLLMRALYEQGLRESLEEGKTRHEFKAAHGFRKYFKTRAEQVMNRLNVEYLLGHSIGLNSNYYRPTEQELLTDFLKAVPSLTIHDQNIESLKEHQEILEEKQEQKDKEIAILKEQMQLMKEQAEIMREEVKINQDYLAQLKPQLQHLLNKVEQNNEELKKEET
jgi:integrase